MLPGIPVATRGSGVSPPVHAAPFAPAHGRGLAMPSPGASLTARTSIVARSLSARQAPNR